MNLSTLLNAPKIVECRSCSEKFIGNNLLRKDSNPALGLSVAFIIAVAEIAFTVFVYFWFIK